MRHRHIYYFNKHLWKTGSPLQGGRLLINDGEITLRPSLLFHLR
jgi:hypothetical protein